MNATTSIRLRARGLERRSAPPALLAAAFPDPPSAERSRGPALATCLATAAAAAAPLLTTTTEGPLDRQAARMATDLAVALAEAAR